MSREERRAYQRMSKKQDPYALPGNPAVRARQEKLRARRAQAARNAPPPVVGGITRRFLGGGLGRLRAGVAERHALRRVRRAGGRRRLDRPRVWRARPPCSRRTAAATALAAHPEQGWGTGIPGAALLVLAGYLIGAIPVGLMIGRLVGGIDLRQHGSGRTGATNTLRTIGVPWGAGGFVLDLAKGAP